MRAVPPALSQIPNLRRSFYVDDITLLIAGGRGGYNQDALQAGVRTVERYFNSNGLQCSPQKSKLLVIYPGRHTPPPHHTIQLYSNIGRPIRQVPVIRILGGHIQANGLNSETIRLLVFMPTR
ncbi:hypothetical protein HPB48_014716 [Haemaphysalis longicornis]|uniref:Reverse transcriptase domain-containing protein n=1 Tax=Haemaphysalis longicornis TaxID=44386 RepID=A0A9J6GRU0_HAELO|nr:hypothetical protein HPB48_014716 [Haemaphysalis longicornis]